MYSKRWDWFFVWSVGSYDTYQKANLPLGPKVGCTGSSDEVVSSVCRCGCNDNGFIFIGVWSEGDVLLVAWDSENFQ